MKRVLTILIMLSCGVISAQTYHIGDLYTAPDGSRGIVYYLHPDGSGGWVVALNDASTGCTWGASSDVPGLANQNPSYYQQLLNDTAGYANTQVLRNYQNNSTTYAAGKVDFAHGWVLPSPAQLSMLYGQLPFIASAITGAGGTALGYNQYWCSAENSASNAWCVDFGTNYWSGYFTYAAKTTSCRVRAVRSFSNTAVVYDTSLTYQWNTGSTQPYINVSPSQTTTYTVTGTTDYGCSTTAEQTILVGTGSSQTIYDTVCQGAGYEANGFTVTEAETGTAGTLVRSRTLTTAGCSSTLTLRLMVKSPVAELVEATACGSYTWNGVTYYESGEYTQTFTAANGCDSVVTLRLTIHHGTHNAVTETVCDSYEWHDSAYTTSGVYTYEYVNADGCPSVDTLHLTVNYGTHNVETETACESYEWHGLTCDTSGTYTYEYTNGDGCPSVDTLRFTRKYAETAEFAETACESYEWNGTTYTESGDYSQTFTAASGCDSVVTLHLTVNHSVAEFVEATACESYTWNDSVYTASGDYPRMFTAANGCDSVITLHLTVNQTSGSLISASLVENSLPCMLNGSSYMEPGTYYQHFTNAVGCDSTLTLQITVYYNQTVAVDSTVCGDALPVVWNDSMFTSAGTKTRVYPAANGADSIVVMTLHVNPSPVAAISGLMALCADSAVTLTADSAYSYLWSTGDTTQVISVMEVGFYTLTVTNEYGCEAVTVHQLSSLGNPILSVTAPDMCAGGSYTFSVGRQGSDNIHLGRGETTLSLADTVFLPDGVYCEPQGCSYRSPLTFAAYAPGSTIQSADDIHYVRLNMEHSYIGDLYINITCPNGQKADLLKYGGSGSSECNNQIPASSRGWAAGDNMPGYIFLGNAYDYNVNSCDPSAFGNEPGEGWNYCLSDNTTQGYTYSTGAGGYIYRFVNATSMGADDIVDSSDVAAGTQFYHPDDPFSNLIGCPLNGPWYIEVQDGWSSDNGYIFGWELALSSEMLPDMPFELAYATADGPWITALSDSLFQIDPPTDLDHDTTIVYTFTVYDTTGCAYDTTVSVNFYATRHTELDTVVCEGFVWNDSLHTTSGQYVRHFVSAVGCDSVSTLNLTVNNPTDTTVSIVVLENALPYQYNDSTYVEAGTYTQYLTNAAGCDSILTVLIDVIENVSVSVDSTVCEAALPLTWNDSVFTAAGTKTTTILAHTGADSTITMTLTVIPTTYSIFDTAVIENALPYQYNEISYVEAGTYTQHLTNAAGCDSILTLTLAVFPNVTGEDDSTICASELPLLWNGVTFTQAGTQTTTLVAAIGADSVVTMTLHVNALSYSNFDTAVVENALPYQYNEISYVEAGTYTQHLTNAAGCDSILTLTLTVFPNVTTELDSTVCESDLPVIWNGIAFAAAGTDSVTLQAATGADSTVVMTLHVVALPVITHSADTVIMPGASVNLWATGEDIMAWTDADGNPLSSGGNLTVAPTVTTTYYITAFNEGNSVVTNGDFESGNAGFTTAYQYNSNLWPEGNYYVGTNAHNHHGNFPNWYDHTTGSGLYMIVNGATVAGTNLWTQTVPVIPHTSYAFSAWVCTLVGGYSSLARLQFSVNATQLGEIFHSPSSTSVWNRYYEVWYSGENTTATLTILNQNTTGGGNDFGVDDIQFSPLNFCNVTDSVTVYVSGQTDSTVCADALPLLWNGVEFTTAGTQTATITTPDGSDSVVVMTLHVNALSYSNFDTTVVENTLPLQYNGILYIEAGTYTQHLTNAAGCDSILTLTLAVFSNVTGEDDSTICASELPLLWNGLTFTQAGTQTATLTATTGADSVVTMTLHVNPLSYTTFDTAVVENALPYQYNEISYVEAGTYTQHLTNAAGCDSILTLTLTVFPNVTTELDSTVCESDLPVIWNGIAFTAAGTDSVTLQAATGADSTVVMTLHVVALPVITHSADTVIMPGASVNLWATGADIMAWTDADGNPLSSGGNLTVAPTATTTYYITAFNEGNSVVTNGDFESGNTGFTTAYQYNSNLWPEGNYYVGTNAHNHHGNFPNWYDHTTGSGLYMIVNGATVAGTNLWTQTVPVIPHTSYAFSAWVCTLVGGYSALARLQFSVNATQLGDIFHSPSSTSVWNRYYEVWYSGENTTATLTILNQNTTGGGNDFGVDDIQFSPLNFCNVTDSVTVYVSGQTDSTVCADALPLLWNGVEFTTAGTQTATITAPDGTDSVVVMTLHVNALSYSNFDTAVVESTLPLQYNGISYIEAGTYTQHLTNAAGCDSILTVNLTVFPNVTSELDSAVCETAFPFTWNDSVFTAAGTKTTTILAHTGSDSTITMTVTMLPTTYGVFDTVIVENALPCQYNEIPYIEAGTYTQYLTNAAGCDSVLTVLIDVIENVSVSVDSTVCEAALPLTWNDSVFTAAGTKTTTILAHTGADSTITMTLTVIPTTYSIFDTAVIENALPYQYNGISYAEAGTYTQYFTNALGCDSVLTIHLTVYQNVTTTVDTTVCAADLPYTWHGHNFTAAGTHMVTLFTSHGADSTVTYHLSVDNISANIGNVTHIICYGESTGAATATVTGGQPPMTYQWTNVSGTNIATTTSISNRPAGTYTFTVTDHIGCTATASVTLNTLNGELQPGTIAASQEVCDGEDIAPFTGTAASGGNNGGYQWQTSTNGTDWTPAPGTNNAQGYTYSNTASSAFTLRRAWVNQSCGTVYSNTVTVSVWPNSIDTITASVCRGETYTEYNFDISADQTAEAGVYTYEQHHATGHCDSAVILLLTVNPAVAELVEATVCEGEGYDANGFSVSPQETIGESVLTRVQNLQTVNGCDSVVTLQLTIIDTALRVEMLTDDFCEHNEASLTVLSPMSDYVWSTGETATTIVVTSPGIYSVTASEGGCSATAHIRVEGCHYELVLPNAITPSRGDGLNDCFYIPEGFIPNINLFKVYIYNRWGELVFYSTDKNFRWYGEYRGQTQYQTIYNYVIEYTDMAGRPQKRQGPITVL